MSPEEIKLLEEVVLDAYEQFLEAVSKGRNISKENLKEIADGRVFTGSKAFSLKLIDEVGDYEKAVKIAAEKANIVGKPNIIEIDRERNPIYDLFSFLGKKETLPYIGKVDKFTSPILYIYPF